MIFPVNVNCFCLEIMENLFLTLSLLAATFVVGSVDNLCKQFGTRSGPTECWS